MAEIDNHKIKKSYRRLIDVEKMPARLFKPCLRFAQDQIK
jgi:hypothetical protein